MIASTASAATFSDVPESHQYYTAIEWAAQSGIVNGFEDGTFQPEQPLTKAQALKVILISSNIAEVTEGEINFPDVPGDSWFYPYVKTAFTKQIVNGEGDGTFSGDKQLIRAAFLKMALLARNIDVRAHIGKDHAADVLASDWFAPYMGYARKVNLITPDLDNNLLPGKITTRGEAVDILLKLARLEKSGDVQKYLSIAESSLLSTIVYIGNNETQAALDAANEAVEYTELAKGIDSEATIVLAAGEIAKGFKEIALAYEAGENGDVESLLQHTLRAREYATSAYNFDNSTQPLGKKIKESAAAIEAQIQIQ